MKSVIKFLRTHPGAKVVNPRHGKGAPYITVNGRFECGLQFRTFVDLENLLEQTAIKADRFEYQLLAA